MKKFLTNNDYHEHNAIGSTTLKYALHSMAKFKAALDGLIEGPSTKALELGQMAHEIILEDKENEYVSAPVVDKRTKAGKEAMAVFNKENEGKKVVDAKDLQMVLSMKESFMKHDLAPNIRKGGEAEMAYFASFQGIEYKAKADYYVQSDEGDYIVDYKTMTGNDFSDVQRAIAKYRYDIQAAHYMKVVEAVEGRPVKDFFWIFQEKEAPYELVVVRASDSMIERAKDRVDYLYGKIAMAKESNIYESKFSQEIVEMDLPDWAIKKEQEDE